jgi:F-type H+-transporting ATPase subunit epsilon
MADLHLEFVSPERVLFSGDVDQVDLPGAEGDMGILPGHAPLVTALRPGIVTVFSGGKREPIVVIGGFAEVSPAGLTVLADSAVARDDFDMATLANEIKDAEEDVADCTDRLHRRRRARQARPPPRTIEIIASGAGAVVRRLPVIRYLCAAGRLHDTAGVGNLARPESMIRKSGIRFSEKIMLHQGDAAGVR